MGKIPGALHEGRCREVCAGVGVQEEGTLLEATRRHRALPSHPLMSSHFLLSMCFLIKESRLTSQLTGVLEF